MLSIASLHNFYFKSLTLPMGTVGTTITLIYAYDGLSNIHAELKLTT